MVNEKRTSRLGWLAAAAVGAIGLCAVAVPTAPAKAQVFFDVGPYGFGVGVAPPPPYYYPPPYYPPPYYYRPYYRHHYYWGW